MTTNPLYRPTDKHFLGFVRGLFAGIVLTLICFGINWSITYWPAIKTTLTNPEAVMNVSVVTKYEIKK